jgi:DNA repair exonuclease SbcCD nuclease subunit
MVPWICAENYNDVMHAMDISKSQILVGHFEINGFEMHKGAFCDGGIDPSVFNKFDLVISGHFHTKSTRGNIVYTGTPYEMTWSDYEDKKGFHIFDTSTRELEFVPNPLSMFHKIWYDDSNSSMDEIVAQDFDKYKDTIVKVIIKNKLNPVWFDIFIEKLEKSGVIDMQVVEDHLNLNLEDDSDIVNEAEDTLTILNKYVSQLELKADKQKLENLLRTLYNEALSME